MHDRQKYHERIVVPVADPLATITALAAAEGGRDYICYEGPDDWSFASGVAAELLADREQVVLRRGDTEVGRPWGDRGLREIPRLLDSVRVDAWRAYGWCGFDLAAAKDGRMDLVGPGVLAHLVIPRVEVRLHRSGTLLRALEAEDLDRYQAALAAPAATYRPEPVAVAEAGAHEYRTAVRAAVKEIKSGRLEKVILSRTVPVGRPVDLVGTYAVGRAANTPARSFLLSLNGLGAAGFSPETVVEVNEAGLVVSQPLAGTRALTGRPEMDLALRRDLLGDAKEVYEHAISVRAALDDVAVVCGPAATEVSEFMVVRERGTVQHLASTVRGRLGPGRGAWDAFAELFPAVTASGVPRGPACEVIRELEPAERGLYAGAVLTYDSAGAMDAALVLRTVFQQDGRAWLRAGAGIVEQSRPAREFTETCEKLASVARYVVPRR